MPIESTVASTTVIAGDRPDLRSGIIDAATNLLRAGGARAVTTRAVAEAAGVPAPTIFRLFGDKDGLMDAVAEHVMAGYAAAKAGSADQDDPVEELRAAWHHHIEFGLATPDLFLLLVAPGRAAGSSAAAAGQTVLRARIARLAAAGLLGVSPARAVDIVHAAGTGVVLTLAAQPVSDRDPGLAAAVFEVVLGSIITARPAPPASELGALAVAFGAAIPQLPALSAAERALMGEWVARAVDAVQD